MVHAVAVAAPLTGFVAVILWFSVNPLRPSPGVEGSIANPLGLVVSNFVYDGSINIENIVVSLAFLLFVCLYYPKVLGMFLAYLLPLVAVAAGALAEFTAVSTPYISLPVCTESCSFYGMSGVASAAVGFTAASFLVLFGVIFLQKRRVLSVQEGGAMTRPKSQALLVCAFVAYVLMLLAISGVIAIPSPPTVHSGSGPSVPAVFVQAPPVALVHSASLFYGFLLCVGVFVQVNRRYHLLRQQVLVRTSS